jgi:hypothetical protein
MNFNARNSKSIVICNISLIISFLKLQRKFIELNSIHSNILSIADSSEKFNCSFTFKNEYDSHSQILAIKNLYFEEPVETIIRAISLQWITVPFCTERLDLTFMLLSSYESYRTDKYHQRFSFKRNCANAPVNHNYLVYGAHFARRNSWAFNTWKVHFWVKLLASVCRNTSEFQGRKCHRWKRITEIHCFWFFWVYSLIYLLWL